MSNKSLLWMVLLILSSIFVALFAGSTTSEPNVTSILPPAIAIISAFIVRQVIVALFAGIWFGAWLIAGRNIEGIFIGLVNSVQKYTVDSLMNKGHIMIILMTLFISGMVGVISANGGMKGTVKYIIQWANNRKRVQLSTALMGLVIFFDDYSNSLIVGNTMRSVTDKMKISREKLAYIIDSTAAPVASVALVSSWVGFQVGLIETSTQSIEGLGEPYLIFIYSLAYSYYPILAIAFVLFIATTGKDFGPMLAAENKAIVRRDSDTQKVISQTENEDSKSGAMNALLPITTLVLSVIIGLFITGEGESLREILGNSDPLLVLLISGFLASIVAITMTLAQNILSLEKTMASWLDGMGLITSALVILVLSWSLAEITKELHTADYLVNLIGDSIAPAMLPALVFILSGVITLGTGTSWGTMGILIPLVIPLSFGLVVMNTGTVAANDMHIIYSSISCVLAGSVWGDHCSPISDTTILSSMASQCNHVEHVRTQMPYALVVGVVSIVAGTAPAGFGMPWWMGFLIGLVVLWLGLNRFGQNCQEDINREVVVTSAIRQS